MSARIFKKKWDDLAQIEKISLRKQRQRSILIACRNWDDKSSKKPEIMEYLQENNLSETSFRSNINAALICANEVDINADGDVYKRISCNSRLCILCNNVRSIKNEKKYLPAIKAFRAPHFVSLTLPGPQPRRQFFKSELKDGLNLLYANRRRISQDRERRKEQPRLKGIWKVECTYHMERRDFHPHLHCLVNSKEAGDWLVDKWLRLTPNANWQGQLNKEADDNSTTELFKYMTKLVADKNYEDLDAHFIVPSAIEAVFYAMQGRRVIQPAGIKAVKEEKRLREEFEVETSAVYVSQTQNYHDANWYSKQITDVQTRWKIPVSNIDFDNPK